MKKNQNYEKVCSTVKGKLQFFKQTPMKVKKKRVIKETPINYVENPDYTLKVKKKKLISDVCKMEKWRSERNLQLAEIQEFCRVGEEYLHSIFKLSTVEVENKVSTKVSRV